MTARSRPLEFLARRAALASRALRRAPGHLAGIRRRDALRLAAIGTSVLIVALTGVMIGLATLAKSDARIGPLEVEFLFSLSLDGGTELQVPPLGAVQVADSHDGPLHLRAVIVGIDRERAAQLLENPDALNYFAFRVGDDLRDAAIRAAFRAVGAAILSGLVLSALAIRDTRRVAWSGALSMMIIVGSFGVALATIRPQSIEGPLRYSGLLTQAPNVVQEARTTTSSYSELGDNLTEFLLAATAVYDRVVTVPDVGTAGGDFIVLHVNDIGSNPLAWSVLHEVAAQYHVSAVIDSGNTTALGSNLENRILEAQISTFKVPYLWVRGDQDSTSTSLAVDSVENATVLDGEVVELGPLRVIGGPSPLRSPVTTAELSATDRAAVEAGAKAVNDQIVAHNASNPLGVNLAVFHEPESATAVAATTPVVLSGSRSGRSVTAIDDDTLLLRQGRSGGGGVRQLNANDQHFAMSLLHFTPQGQLKAYDDMVVYGPGRGRVEFERILVPDGE
ncbi:hypothetical protein [Micromonospora sp. NPDC005324]|uniref:hypothetical protein n=1 Tax=Micromonospora sp. NPDC005324 TaxID=3157033 RepID=UPI0033B016FF